MRRPTNAAAGVARLVCLLALILAFVSAVQAAQGPSSLTSCSEFASAFEPSIFSDLLPWASTGIDAELAERSLQDRTVYNHSRPRLGLQTHGIGFMYKRESGLHVLADPRAFLQTPFAKHIINYVGVMRDLVETFSDLPDVEFVVRALVY